ncbi:hypothetical protein PUN49_25020 [Pseudomonas extremaustralis]|jgi:uncharacterized protein CbrC (UPF0167 family)|uniref:Uncharacterized protein n=2 Tax=Pseudomonas TaxID=286 RepID=A0A5C5Q663_9PSED|nr:hypothetical protein [Pseudomonas extremaustralis]EZI25648.1 hypothetical protein PE143B_0123525 [Pseudomonas extremaustralis 14-3 substr. 14-3b]MDF3135517.1 hypothetical protein [Pseudomonas extremaustralis]MDG2970273.1 hypothetical protein [Pseudomonas extremaustralis]TWS01253.1 hypothetical protein FIV36_26215 [Pseudomonas extremaustralis]UUJ38658.1 hypothetical protein L1A22_18175 [Pseudomonas extremaustralis]
MTTFPVSDGTIEKVTCNRNTLIMEFTDWQEASWEITFNDLVAFQGIGAVGSEICDMYEEENSSLSQEATRLDPSETGKSYCFTASNGGEVIFQVIAGSYSAQKI